MNKKKQIIKIPKRYKSSNKYKYSEPYKEYNFKDSLRFESSNNYYNTTYNNENGFKGYSKSKKAKCKKRVESPNDGLIHQKPFISATCSYGKYFDEPLQKGGISKLEYFYN